MQVSKYRHVVYLQAAEDQQTTSTGPAPAATHGSPEPQGNLLPQLQRALDGGNKDTGSKPATTPATAPAPAPAIPAAPVDTPSARSLLARLLPDSRSKTSLDAGVRGSGHSLPDMSSSTNRGALQASFDASSGDLRKPRPPSGPPPPLAPQAAARASSAQPAQQSDLLGPLLAAGRGDAAAATPPPVQAQSGPVQGASVATNGRVATPAQQQTSPSNGQSPKDGLSEARKKAGSPVDADVRMKFRRAMQQALQDDHFVDTLAAALRDQGLRFT